MVGGEHSIKISGVEKVFVGQPLLHLYFSVHIGYISVFNILMINYSQLNLISTDRVGKTKAAASSHVSRVHGVNY